MNVKESSHCTELFRGLGKHYEFIQEDYRPKEHDFDAYLGRV